MPVGFTAPQHCPEQILLMELLLLGTAAAEAWPAVFCECYVCEQARKRGGPNIRSRSGALIDEDFKIDFCPDSLIHTQQNGLSFAHLKTLLFTHQHQDHIAPDELVWMLPGYTNTPLAQPLATYGNSEVIAILEDLISRHPRMGEFLDLRLLEPFRKVTTPDGDEILPLPADHVEGALVLRITRSEARGGKAIFYGHDSGFYPEATLDALSAEKPVDIALFDCTFGIKETDNRGHMNVQGVIQMATELRQRGVLTDSTRAIATHFSHNGGALHEELINHFLPHRIEVAYDRMVVSV
jgi:phosphoribosyl 1,2-cyclic phosphate phosphodiesterase